MSPPPSSSSSTWLWSRPTNDWSPSPGSQAAKVAFVTLYHLILESTLGLTTFKFTTDYLKGEGLLPGFVDGYSKIHHDETRHIGYGVWFLRESVAADPELGDVVRETLRELLPVGRRVAFAIRTTVPATWTSTLSASASTTSATSPSTASSAGSSLIGVPLETL